MNDRSPKPITLAPTRKISLDELMAQQQKAREVPVILTRDDYTDAVSLLVSLAEKDCGGSRVAAQVLLSAYNGDNWHLDVTDLCNLGGAYYRAAIIVIRCRVELSCEPHRVIDNGSFIFDQLEKDWQLLHVNRRYQSRH